MAQHIDEVIDGTPLVTDPIDWPGGAGVMLVQGELDGMVAFLKFQIDSINWTTVTGETGTAVSLATNGMRYFSMCACKLRVEVTGAGSEPNVRVRVAPSRHGWFNDPALL
jgi:hypothetical protein